MQSRSLLFPAIEVEVDVDVDIKVEVEVEEDTKDEVRPIVNEGGGGVEVFTEA